MSASGSLEFFSAPHGHRAKTADARNVVAWGTNSAWRNPLSANDAEAVRRASFSISRRLEANGEPPRADTARLMRYRQVGASSGALRPDDTLGTLSVSLVTHKVAQAPRRLSAND